MGTWIDFKELRSKLRFVDVLKHFNVQVKIKGDRASGFCPLPGHHGKGQGKPRSPSFSVHLGKGIFQCFSCSAKGNVLDFFCLMSGLNPDNPAELREGAIKAQEVFGFSASKPPAPGIKAPGPRKTEAEARPEPAKTAANVIVNAPLDFELKHLDWTHPYLGSRGFTAETIAHFGLGYCSKGLMAGRVAIPLHDADGRLIGYAGRLVDHAKISDGNPKYLFPGRRERNEMTHEFRKGELLYNYDRITKPTSRLIVVEGFASVWWLHQHEFSQCVAVMGASCSLEQAELIAPAVEPRGLLSILTDGDDAGEHCALSIFGQCGAHVRCRWHRLVDRQQPTDLSADELNVLLSV